MNKGRKIFFIIIISLFVIGVVSLMSGVIYYYNSLGSVSNEESGKEIKVKL